MSAWSIDPAHTNVEFAVRHMMIATVRGRFGELSGEITENNGQFGVKITIPVASIDTRQSQRDDHLRSADFFDVANHPALNFAGTFEGDPKTGGKLTGDLTIRGTTKKVVLEVEGNGSAKDPWGNEFKYAIPGKAGPFDITSLGADGKEGGDGANRDVSL